MRFQAVITYPTADLFGSAGTVLVGSSLSWVMEEIQEYMEVFPGSRVTLVRKPC